MTTTKPETGTTTAAKSAVPKENRTHPRYTTTATVHRERMSITPPIERQQAIENALSMALWHVRHGTGDRSIQAATGRAIRAAAMLKQACTESTIGGRA
jgi:hypothetical protein